MGQALRKLLDTFFGNNVIQVVMMGLDISGKTTMLNNLQSGKVFSTLPTVGINYEKVQFKNVMFSVCEIGGQGSAKLRLLWKHIFYHVDGLIYVVDSSDRERIEMAKAEFQAVIKDPLMLNSAMLVLANKQDREGAMTPMEVCEELGLLELGKRKWHIRGTCALNGDGLRVGFDSLASTLKEMRASKYSSQAISSF